MKPTTIKDVATHAGVSIKTVSYVLNNGASVSERTREAVLEAVRALNYRPNRAARAMRLRQAFSIALVLYGGAENPAFGDLSDPAIAVIVASMANTAEAHGYTLSLSSFATSDLRAYQKGLAQGQFDGGIFMPYSRNLEALAPFLDTPMVVIDEPGVPAGVPAICIDYRDGVRQAVAHLRRRGYGRIAFLGGPEGLNAYHNTERYAGYAEGLEACGLDRDAKLVVPADFTFEGARAAFPALMALKPDAVLAANDRMAIAVHREARSRGLRIPDDLAIVGFDDLESAQYVDPALTTVHHPLVELGRRSAEMLIGRVEGRLEPALERVTLKTRLVVRASA